MINTKVSIEHVSVLLELISVTVKWSTMTSKWRLSGDRGAETVTESICSSTFLYGRDDYWHVLDSLSSEIRIFPSYLLCFFWRQNVDVTKTWRRNKGRERNGSWFGPKSTTRQSPYLFHLPRIIAMDLSFSIIIPLLPSISYRIKSRLIYQLKFRVR